jgi:hypothetical protein
VVPRITGALSMLLSEIEGPSPPANGHAERVDVRHYSGTW